MGKKHRKKASQVKGAPAVDVSPFTRDYAILLAAVGLVTIDALDRVEARSDDPRMPESAAALRAALQADVTSAATAAARMT